MSGPGPPPSLFDPHVHPESLSDRDLESMRIFGVEKALLLASAHHGTGAPRASEVLGRLEDLLSRQLVRVERAGIRAWAALGVHPEAVPARGLPEILAALPDYFGGGKVIALGEVGLHRGGPAEEEALVEQLRLARRLKLAVVVHSPRPNKDASTRRILTLVRDSGLPAGRILVDHANGKTLKAILARGHHAGLTVHPDELSAERAVALVGAVGTERVLLDSDSGEGVGDILGLARAARLLERAELSREVISRVTRENAEAFFRIQS